MGQITHLWRRLPMKSWRPMRAKTLRQKTVRIITSESFFTDWIRAPTMVFRPGGKSRTQTGDAGGDDAPGMNIWSVFYFKLIFYI